MDDCFETSTLRRWLDGILPELEAEKIARHVESCDHCQQRLTELTDDDSISPPGDSSALSGGPTFTGEPHFASLQRRLGEKVKRLVREQTAPNPKPGPDELKNRIETTHPLLDTVTAEDTPTVSTDSNEINEIDLNSDVFGAQIAIDGFRIERLIGRGGFANVYQAWDKNLSRSVAVKVLDHNRIDARNRHRFAREAKTASSIDSPNVINVLSSGETADGQPFIVMELVKGGSLADWIARQQKQNQLDRNAINEGVELVIQACRGAEAVHQSALVHRDIKPGNIFVDGQNSKLGDFGLARLLEGDTVTLTRAAETTGTPAYMSPEQTDFAADVDSRSDVYSLGATLYHVITGQAPFRGSSLAILKQVFEVEPANPCLLNESVAADLETICQKAMSKHPEHRYASVEALADDLQRFIDGQPILARPIPAWRRLLMWQRRNRALASSLGLLLLALVLGTVGTTAMWIKSSHNASEARQYATSLEENRTRLRESVSRFQQRIFSDQAMHWQMPESFRAEMFADVISYLDEFAELETRQNTHDGQINDLNNDYLLVAQAAIDVNRYRDAQVASDRVLKRLEKNSDADKTQQLNYRAARLAYLARTPSTKFFDLANTNKHSDSTECQQLALLCQTAIQPTEDSQTENPYLKLQKSEASFLTIAAKEGRDQSDLAAAKELFDAVAELQSQTSDNEFRLEAIEVALRIGWYLSDVSPSSESIPIIEKSVELVESMRESLRQLSMSLTESDWHKATNYARLAMLNRKTGDLEGAIASASEAQHAFRKAVLMRPQHRIWTDDMICLQLLLGDWLVEEEKLPLAAETLNDSVMHNIRLAKSYPNDVEIQKRTIKIFVKMAETSEQQKLHDKARRLYYIAARDCQLIMLQEEHRDWAFETRLWLMSKTMEQLNLAPNQEAYDGIAKFEEAMIKNWGNKSEAKASLMQAVFDGEKQPPRPKYLQFQQITDDVLKGL